MGLFDKKYCDICGEKIGLLGNRKLAQRQSRSHSFLTSDRIPDQTAEVLSGVRQSILIKL